MKDTFILWGLHPKYGPNPVKICEYSKAEENYREDLGWICQKTKEGQRPDYLDLLSKTNGHHETGH